MDVIDLAEARLPDVLSNQPAASVTATSQRLAAADAFVVVTPEYNHSFPASLKNAIDWHFKEWQAKPVGFVSYGGMSGGLRAVEHLRQVFVELHAVTVRDAVSFHGVWGLFDTDGQPKDAAGCRTRRPRPCSTSSPGGGRRFATRARGGRMRREDTTNRTASGLWSFADSLRPRHSSRHRSP